ncbi:MAG: O-antigen ligase family protein [Ardenticatenaceae bacterium]
MNDRFPLASRLLRWSSFLLLLLMPFSFSRPLGDPAAPRVLPIYAAPGLEPSDLGVFALLLSFALVVAAHPKSARRYVGPRAILSPLLGLPILAFLTAPWAVAPSFALYSALRWLLTALVYVALVRPEVPFARGLLVFALGIVAQTLLGIAQVVTQGPLGLPGELALEPALSGAAILSVGGTRWLRAYGMTFHPNILGGYIAVGLMVTLPLLRGRLTWLLWWLLGVGLLLSFSRAAMLALLLVLPFVAGWMFWGNPALRRPLAIALGGALVAVLLASLPLAGQIVTRLRPSATWTEARSLDERGDLLGVALTFIAERPLTGVGAGNFAVAIAEMRIPELPQPVHNVLFLLAAEIGLLGGMLWLLLWLTPSIMAGGLLARPDPWLLAGLGAWLVLGIISLWDSYPWAFNAGRLLTVAVLAWYVKARNEVMSDEY